MERLDLGGKASLWLGHKAQGRRGKFKSPAGPAGPVGTPPPAPAPPPPRERGFLTASWAVFFRHGHIFYPR